MIAILKNAICYKVKYLRLFRVLSGEMIRGMGHLIMNGYSHESK